MKLYYFVACICWGISATQCNSQKVINSDTNIDDFLKWVLENRSEKIVSQRTAQLSYGYWKDISIAINYPADDSIKIKKLIDDNNATTFNYKSSFAGKVFLSDSALNARSNKSAYLFLRISKPIFFDNGNKVWILIEEQCGDNCGSGKIQVFKKSKKTFLLLSEKMIWIS